ncbi:MAG: hypothetical protein IPI02_06425 [Sterolibacteriaceae bacterium]|nr:hypothetical protein [Sterolibacteriaceae bacterium]
MLDEASAVLRVATARASPSLPRSSTSPVSRRGPTVRAAEEAVTAARRALAQVQWRLDQKSQRAPVDALVRNTRCTGQAMGRRRVPVVSLLPPANIKLRFFVSEPMLGASASGRVSVRPATAAPFDQAAISTIAPQIITRRRSSTAGRTGPSWFHGRARPNQPDPCASIGQPVDVRLEGVAGKSP